MLRAARRLIRLYVPRSTLLFLTLLIFLTWMGAEPAPAAVDEIARGRLLITTPEGTGALPIYASSDWSKPRPEIVRAILIFHGKKRNAGSYFQSAQEAVKSAKEAGRGTIVIAPQFLAEEDATAFHLDPGVLRWHNQQWEAGENAVGPSAISSFDAIDAVLAQLAERSQFPNLTQVVLAGHSGGGQVLQRYAVVGRGETALSKAGVKVRYVIANPSSYVYFSEDRPLTTSEFAHYGGSCAGFNLWKYGVVQAPPYVGQASFAEMEDRYSRRDVIYLLGMADTDPHHPDLDVSCQGEAEGPNRFARGSAYFNYMKARHVKEFSQRLWEVPGVAHDERGMFHSPCGMEALFDIPGCSSAK